VRPARLWNSGAKPRKPIDRLSSEMGPQCHYLRMEPPSNTISVPMWWIAETGDLSVSSRLEASMASSISP